tara:strand:- start:1120 stop:2133 length:1014 start_codon:yes stop_codon:yes gene_type:complete
MKSKPFKFIGFVALSCLFAFVSQAQSVSSTPVGYVTQTISAGTGTGRVFTPIALPLYSPSSVANATGAIGSVSATGFTVTGASFPSLSDAATPYAVRITSGTLAGVNLHISANTADSITVDFSLSSVSSTSGLVADDTYEIIEVDTLNSLLGGPADEVIFSAATQADADVVYVFSGGAWLSYFHNGTNWVRKSGRSTIISDDLPLTADRAILFSRISASSTSYILTGTVPSTNSTLKLNGSGLSYLANNTPTDITLANLGLEAVTGFENGATGDSIYLYTNGSWLKYNFDGTNWIRKSGRSTIISNDIVIPSGTGFVFSKNGSASEASASLDLQYTL